MLSSPVREGSDLVVWVFTLYLAVATAGSNGHARRFEHDGQLVYPTREVCQAARAAIRRLDPSTDHYFLEDCTAERRDRPDLVSRQGLEP